MEISNPWPLIIFLACEFALLVLWGSIRLIILHVRRTPLRAFDRLRRPTLRQPSALLRLPAELRLEIWRLALPEAIGIDRANPLPQVPDICLARRQTFFEALPVFVRQSRFDFRVDGGDGVYLTRTFARIDELMSCIGRAEKEPKTRNYHLYLRGTPRWQALLHWAEAVHEGGNIPCSEILGASGDADEAVTSTLSIAWRLRYSPWEEVKKVLELLPAARDPRWA